MLENQYFIAKAHGGYAIVDETNGQDVEYASNLPAAKRLCIEWNHNNHFVPHETCHKCKEKVN